MTPLSVSHVLITGASSGLGAALARYLAARQSALTLLGRDWVRLQEVAEHCQKLGARQVETWCCDVRDEAAMHTVLIGADDRLPVDVVIANAGLGGAAVLAGHDVEATDLAREIVRVNIIGTINTIGPLQPRFVTRRSGRFVVVGSMAGYEGLAMAPTYAASKAAVRTYAHGLRRLLAPHGVHVNVVTPGFVETPMSASLPFGQPFKWSAERAAERIVTGMARNEAEIAFPWQLVCAAKVARWLPVRLVDRLLLQAQVRLGPGS